MDISIINRFREIVNSGGFTHFWYSTRSELNQWNCICSAMDWITVSVEHINSTSLSNVKNMTSIEVFAFISCVDLIVESIQQLHRVIHKTTELLYKDDNDIFSGNQFGQSDIRYFKTLRSCFGAHPVNLDEPGSEHDKQMRRFASWSTNILGNGTSSVILYSNQQNEKNIFLSFDLQQILCFANKYYTYLKCLGDSLFKQYEAFAAEKRAEKILSNDDPIVHLDILLEASKQRLDNGVFRSNIQELKLLFSIEITAPANRELVNLYRKDLLLLIDELHDHLQNMDFNDLKHDIYLYPSPKCMPNGWSYWYEKLCENVIGGGCHPIIWEKQIRSLFSPYVELRYSSYEELFLLVQASLHFLKQRE